MNYYIDLSSPETAKAFENSTKSVSGFRISRKTYVENKKQVLVINLYCL